MRCANVDLPAPDGEDKIINNPFSLIFWLFDILYLFAKLIHQLKASAKKPKAVAKKATTSSKAKKKDDDKVSKSSSVDDKKAESDEKPAEGTA